MRFHRHWEPYIYLVQSAVPLVSVWFYVWKVWDVLDVLYLGDGDDVFLVVVTFLELKKGNWLISYVSRN